MQNQKNDFQGYGLFNDVEDDEIRIYNRARSLKNIILDNADKDRNLNLNGMAKVASYMALMPTEERDAIHAKLKELLQVKEVV